MYQSSEHIHIYMHTHTHTHTYIYIKTSGVPELITILFNLQERQTALFSATQTKKVCLSYFSLTVITILLIHAKTDS